MVPTPPQSIAESETRPSPALRWHIWASYALTGAVICRLIYASFLPLFLSAPWMVFFEDDFFYYLKVAQNLAHGAGSTANGIVLTNGYHPLWLLLLAGFSFFTHNPRALLAYGGVLGLLSGLCIYFLSRRILLMSGLGILASSALAAAVTAYSSAMAFRGMEVTLAVPLMLLVATMALNPARWLRTAGSSSLFGLAVAAMALSRLDSMIFAAFLVLSLLAIPAVRRSLRVESAIGFSAGLLPIAVYFVSNILIFHTLLPVSGMAKQLKSGLRPSRSVLRMAFGRSEFDPILLVLLLAIVVLLWQRRRFSAPQRAVYLSCLVFPFFYISLLSCLSDWPLPAWYFYAFRPAFCISLAVLAAWNPIRALLRNSTAAAALAVLTLATFPAIRWDHGSQQLLAMYDVALDLRSFSATHPGVYAMGDRAGIPMVLMSSPIIQTEGLVMDRGFLKRIREHEPLLEALAPYHVRYYITTDPGPHSGCLHVAEPYQAGPASPHMEADICGAPVATFVHSIAQNRIRYVFVYDLQPAAAIAH